MDVCKDRTTETGPGDLSAISRSLSRGAGGHANSSTAGKHRAASSYTTRGTTNAPHAQTAELSCPAALRGGLREPARCPAPSSGTSGERNTEPHGPARRRAAACSLSGHHALQRGTQRPLTRWRGPESRRHPPPPRRTYRQPLSPALSQTPQPTAARFAAVRRRREERRPGGGA